MEVVVSGAYESAELATEDDDEPLAAADVGEGVVYEDVALAEDAPVARV